MQHDNELKYYKDMAGYIKSVLDKKLGGAWHIIVGKSFSHFSLKYRLNHRDNALKLRGILIHDVFEI